MSRFHLIKFFGPMFVCAFLFGTARFASAQAPRFALVVGSNRGSDPARTLRYAERDAARFAEILTRLGGFNKTNVHLLLRPTAADISTGLDAIDKKISTGRGKGEGRALAVVYFSGHADGIHLELGGEKLPFALLRKKVEKLRSDVKILFVDSCQSGGVTSYKGGKPGPPFDLVFTETMDANGTAILTSSAAGEKSLESGRLGGSFFTHFLISGLSGTADVDQDRQVTLNEIYQYTYNKTVAETARTMGGTQHPTYDFRMTGRGKVVLTDLTMGASLLQFGPETGGSYFILRDETDEIVAEVNKQKKVWRSVALPPAVYRVAAARNGKVFAGTVRLAKGERVRVLETDLVPEPKLETVFAKGTDAPPGRGVGLAVYYGMMSGALKRYSVLHEGIIALRLDLGKISLFPKVSLGATHIDEDGFQYRLLLLTGEGGIAWRFDHAAIDLFLGLNLGGGYGRQQLTYELRYGGIFIYTLLGGLELPLSRHFGLSVFWEVGSHVYRAENELTQNLLLRGSIGAGVHF